MLETVGLEKSFGQIRVTSDVNLKIESGERRVVLGPNGAGKTTLFNILAGEIRPSAGTIRLGGEDVTAKPVEARAALGLARSYQKNNLFDELTIRENLALAAATSKGAAGWFIKDTLADRGIADEIDDVARRVGLGDLLDQPVDAVCLCARRHLEVVLALVRLPRILFFEETRSCVGP